MSTIIFYDFEVFKHDWLVVLINPFTQEKKAIINNKKALAEFYEKHKKDIWVGYNSSSYDKYILKAILLDFNPKEVSDWIIVEKRKGWEFSSLFNKYPLNNYDCMGSRAHSLKTLEAFMGHSVEETEVDFNLDRKLTREELALTLKYCYHDVEETMSVFLQNKSDFDAKMALLKAFNLPLKYIDKTQAQLAAIILKAKRKDFIDEWCIRLPDTLQLSRYKYVADWFMDHKNQNEEAYLECDIAGTPHLLAWGGLHGAIPKYHYTCKDDELLVMADVDQLYPTLMIRYKLLSRAVDDYEDFEYILSESLRLKALKLKKERAPYKLICNITYGSEGDQYNPMYDPLHRKLVCIFGQVLMVDLIEKIEDELDITLVQSNTDGILLKIKKADFDKLDDIVYDWEQRTGLHMSFDCYKTIIQKDVNNYIAIDYKGHYKSKGAYVKSLNDLDYDLPIVNKALIARMVQGVPLEKTINDCNELREFQKIYKVSAKYLYAIHNHTKLHEKTFRVFASTDTTDTFLGKAKVKKNEEVVEKFANSPDHCFIANGDISGLKVPDKLDRQYYIDVARKRLKQFGYDS